MSTAERIVVAWLIVAFGVLIVLGMPASTSVVWKLGMLVSFQALLLAALCWYVGKLARRVKALEKKLAEAGGSGGA